MNSNNSIQICMHFNNKNSWKSQTQEWNCNLCILLPTACLKMGKLFIFTIRMLQKTILLRWTWKARVRPMKPFQYCHRTRTTEIWSFHKFSYFNFIYGTDMVWPLKRPFWGLGNGYWLKENAQYRLHQHARLPCSMK